MDFPETILRLDQIESKEKINIITNEMTYTINKSFAAAISPIFFQAIKENPMIQEIYLPINENIKEFFKGKSIDRELFLAMSIILDNNDFYQKSKEENKINKENIINRFMTFVKCKVKIENMKEEIEFIGKYFKEFENKIEIDKIPSEYLSEIIKNARGIEREEKMYKYIIKRIKQEEDKNNRKKLIESIDIRGLNNNDIKDLIEKIKYEEVSEQLFSIMKQKILSVNSHIIEECEEKEDCLMFFLEYQQGGSYVKDPIGFTPLHYAATNNSKKMTKLLISKGSDVNAIDNICQILKTLFLIKKLLII